MNYPIGNLSEGTLAEHWNSNKMRNIRRKMISGEKLSECDTCYQLENSKLESYRQSSNRTWKSHMHKISRTQDDGTFEPFELPYLDIRFSNICNLRCRTCSPEFSSKIAAEQKEYSVLNINEINDKVWDDIEQLIPKVEYVYFAGGEPLIMDEHYKMLSSFEKNNHYDVELLYSTNFSTLGKEGVDLPNIWRRFKKVTILASLDDSNKRAEYIRKDLDWNKVLENRKVLREKAPEVDFKINLTLSTLNALSVIDFHREWVNLGLIDVQDFYIKPVLSPLIYNIQIFPDNFKKELRRKYENYINEVKEKYGDASENFCKELKSSLNFLDKQNHSHEIFEQFLKSTTALDEKRGENFLDVFSEWAPLLNSNDSKILKSNARGV
jgi:organic radical activating enzyme